MTAQKEYIITEEMIQIWRNGCVNIETPRTEGNFCKKCQYRGKGAREKCCDFSDVEAERIFRSHPAKSEAVLEELRKHFVKLYDDGFKDPLVTFDAAISMMKYGDTKLRQQER